MKTLFSFGNRKIPKDTAIFNMTPAKECPSEKLGLCTICNKCYAKKAERMYKDCLPYRYRQMNYWNNIDSNTFVNDFSNILSRKKIVTKYLRVSESGDFKNQSDVQKLSEIAEQLKGKVKVYTYTARKDLNFDNLSKNLTVNGSGFMISNNFYVIKNKSEMIDKYICLGDCGKCNLCKSAGYKNIAVLEH